MAFWVYHTCLATVKGHSDVPEGYFHALVKRRCTRDTWVHQRGIFPMGNLPSVHCTPCDWKGDAPHSPVYTPLEGLCIDSDGVSVCVCVCKKEFVYEGVLHSAVVTWELLASNLHLLFMQLHGVELRLGSTLVHLFLCHPVREAAKDMHAHTEHAQVSLLSFCICDHPCTHMYIQHVLYSRCYV